MALIAAERSLIPHSVDHVCLSGSSTSTPGSLFTRERQRQQLHWMPPRSFSTSSTSGRIGCCHVTYLSSTALGVEKSTQGRIATSGSSRSSTVAITSRLEHGGATAAANSSKINAATRQTVSLPRPTAWPVHAAVADTAGEGLKWWERESAPNLIDIHSTQQFVDALQAAGDKLVIVKFFASWCPSCRALYPKYCQMVRENSDIFFLKVNFDENKPMCKSLNVKVLPFFHIYRGAAGRLEAFSCSLSKLQRLRDAISKHHDGPCEGCDPPEVMPEALTALLKKRSPDPAAAPAGSTD